MFSTTTPSMSSDGTAISTHGSSTSTISNPLPVGSTSRPRSIRPSKHQGSTCYPSSRENSTTTLKPYPSHTTTATSTATRFSTTSAETSAAAEESKWDLSHSTGEEYTTDHNREPWKQAWEKTPPMNWQL